MHTQRDLKFLLQRSYLHLKNLKLLFWIPVVVVNLVIPALNIMRYKTSGMGELLRFDIINTTLLLLPFLSVWWVIFVLREYIEADGSEVLYVCSSKIKLADALCPFLLYLINISVLYGVYAKRFPHLMGIEYLRMLCICVFFFGLAYFFVYLTKSITISLMVLVLYFLASVMIKTETPIFPLYQVQQELSRELLMQFYVPLLSVGLLLTGAGVLINKKMACKN